jgi:hypothetical protein
MEIIRATPPAAAVTLSKDAITVGKMISLQFPPLLGASEIIDKNTTPRYRAAINELSLAGMLTMEPWDRDPTQITCTATRDLYDLLMQLPPRSNKEWIEPRIQTEERYCVDTEGHGHIIPPKNEVWSPKIGIVGRLTNGLGRMR